MLFEIRSTPLANKKKICTVVFDETDSITYPKGDQIESRTLFSYFIDCDRSLFEPGVYFLPTFLWQHFMGHCVKAGQFLSVSVRYHRFCTLSISFETEILFKSGLYWNDFVLEHDCIRVWTLFEWGLLLRLPVAIAQERTWSL